MDGGEILNSVQTNAYTINIGTKKLQFDIKDSLFLLDKPIKEKHPASNCHCCERDFTSMSSGGPLRRSSPVNIPEAFCDFCGHRNCE